MNLLLRFVTIGILSVLVFGFGSTHDVWACSGGSETPLNERIDNTPVIVQGRIIALDDAGVNAILEVDTYLKGHGAKHLLLGLYSPAMVEQSLYRSELGCNYPPQGLYPNMNALHFLTRQEDGSYRWSPRSLFDAGYYLVGEDGGYWSAEDTYTYIETTYDEFLAVIQDYVGTSPTLPDADAPYPMLAPLLITTESGVRYLYPIDKQLPIAMSAELILRTRRLNSPCWERNCQTWSKNGLYRALLMEDGNVIINPNYYSEPVSLYEETDAIIFSSAEDKLATLKIDGDKVQISIYILYEHHHTIPELFTRLQINAQTILPNMLIWNSDGRMIAYSDNDGVWVWDVFTDTPPQFIIATDMPIQHFSPLGRYLTIGADKNGLSFDIISEKIFPAGVTSPDENYLVEYGTHSLTHRLSPFRPDLGDVVGNGVMDWVSPPYNKYSAVEIYWTSHDSYLIRVCSLEDRYDCVIRQHHLSLTRYRYTPSSDFIPASDFAVHAQMGDIVIVTEGHKLSFDMNQTQYDLSPYLDSPMAKVEWLPSLFYYND